VTLVVKLIKSLSNIAADWNFKATEMLDEHNSQISDLRSDSDHVDVVHYRASDGMSGFLLLFLLVGISAAHKNNL